MASRRNRSSDFDRIMILDWSASNSPKTGTDSIWIADSHAPTTNPPTRSAAMSQVETAIDEALKAGHRLLIGWDFAFGYPEGFARAVGLQGWRGVWSHLHDAIDDGADNRSNRFDVAAALNRRLPGDHGPFWGYVGKHCPDGLSPKLYPDGQRRDWPFESFEYLRQIESRLPSASPVFKLAYTGSVGSQALLGIARLEGLRRRFAGSVAIWPFETRFADALNAPVVLAEIYPSNHIVPDGSGPKDERQVEAVLRDFREWNADDGLRQALSAPSLLAEARQAAQSEEGWIVGL